ncbi:MAG: hypothetical protein K2P81_05210 [Bacteriovoracaceae bacterium]|nr:hypothetical protein [Bacteriovoracaceae bacterium]
MMLLWIVLDLTHAIIALVLLPLRLTPWGFKRAQFERKRDPFKKRADWSFEISSEGEFEQVRPWIEDILERKQNIEIVFSSPSVLRTVQELSFKHAGLVRLIPLPLLTHTPFVLVRELSAPRLVLCRYDFFPSVMARASVSGVISGVVWASFIGKRSRLETRFWKFIYRYFYGTFHWVVPATLDDETLFKKLGTVKVFRTSEMRVAQITKRVDQRNKTLMQKFPHWEKFNEYLETFPKNHRWLMGSFWEVDLALLKSPELKRDVQEGKTIVLLIPHKLGSHWREKIQKFGMPLNYIDSNWSGEFTKNALWLLDLKGVLCELYSHVGVSYVGGGFGRSVHSVIEPYVSGSQIICGPKIHRSTEVEKIKNISPSEIVVLNNQQELEEIYLRHELTDDESHKRNEWVTSQQARLLENLKEVEKIC